MQGVKRVIVFCFLIVVLPAALIIIPLHLRHFVFADVVFPVAESDIIEIRDGISNIFCQSHSLRMNSSFNAFQLKTRPEISANRKHIRLKKSMTLPDDTLEYWGFYLLKGAIVELKVCSRYEGSRILVVKGDRNLRTCGLLEHNTNKVGTHFAQGHDKVVVTFETAAELVVSDEQRRFDYHNKEYRVQNDDSIADLKAAADEELENHGGEMADDSPHIVKTRVKQNKTASYQKNASSDKTIATDHKTERVLVSSNLGNHNETDQMMGSTGSIAEFTERPENKLRHRRSRKLQRRAVKGIYEPHISGHHDPFLQKHPVHNAKHKRDIVYNRKISHGGNALNFTDEGSNSISSFENSLLTCYNGQILLAQGFAPSSDCLSVRFFESGTHMVSKHEVVEDGYYYYIFYSDNDLVRNDIHAVFDIYKPTFEYANLTNANACVNCTNCTFPIEISADDIVIVEVPTRDGIEHDDDDITYLISTCHPRMSVYVIFPISVLLLILSCAFI